VVQFHRPTEPWPHPVWPNCAPGSRSWRSSGRPAEQTFAGNRTAAVADVDRVIPHPSTPCLRPLRRSMPGLAPVPASWRSNLADLAANARGILNAPAAELKKYRSCPLVGWDPCRYSGDPVLLAQALGKLDRQRPEVCAPLKRLDRGSRCVERGDGHRPDFGGRTNGAGNRRWRKKEQGGGNASTRGDASRGTPGRRA